MITVCPAKRCRLLSVMLCSPQQHPMSQEKRAAGQSYCASASPRSTDHEPLIVVRGALQHVGALTQTVIGQAIVGALTGGQIGKSLRRSLLCLRL